MAQRLAPIVDWVKDHRKRLLLITLLGLFGLFLVAVVILYLNPGVRSTESAIPPTPTMQPPGELSQLYGNEVSRIIEDFEIDGHTVKMYQSEAYHAEVYTGPYLEFIDGYFLSFNETTPWPIVSEASVTRIIVIEYSAEKIRALACVTEQKLDLDSKSKLIGQEPVSYVNGAYVFLKEDSVWKLASYLDMSDTDTARLEYSMMDEELKEITGSFNSLIGLTCGE
jgi:hypothetical protein